MTKKIIKKFADIKLRDRKDKQYMLALRDTYEKNVDNFEENNDYRKIDNVIFKIEEEEKAEAARIKKLEDKIALAEAGRDNDERFDEAVRYWTARLTDSFPTYHIEADDKIHYYDNTLFKWRDVSVSAFGNNVGAFDAFSIKALKQALIDMGRMKKEAVWSFREQPPYILNKLTRDGWMKPEFSDDCKYHVAFDILFNSLSAGRQDVIDHIQQCIVWKYLHPEDYTLPALSIFGAGGLGKNTFAIIMSLIFGEDQVVTLSFADIKDFRKLLTGKAFVFIDEMLNTNDTGAVLKLLIGNRYIVINKKGVDHQQYESTAWFMAGGNDKMGTHVLDGTEADRRFSIIKSKLNAKYFTKKLMHVFGDDIDDAMTDNLKVLADPKEVAKFLGFIVREWGDQERTPKAYHGDDYDALLNIQKGSFETFMESVFLDKRFTWIKTTVLFETYGLYVHAYFRAGTRFLLGRTKFFIEVNEWLADNDTTIRKKQLVYVDQNQRKKKTIVFIADGLTAWNKPDLKVDTTPKYITIKTDNFDNIIKTTINSERFPDSYCTEIHKWEDGEDESVEESVKNSDNIVEFHDKMSALDRHKKQYENED